MVAAFVPRTVLELASLGDPSLWIGAVILFALCMQAYLLHALLAQARRVERSLQKLDGLQKLHALVAKMVEGQQALDLRRLEHVLLDIRDGQKRSEERLLALVESSNAAREAPNPRASERGERRNTPLANGAALSERMIGRLLALGFERIELVTPIETLDQLAERDGEVMIEARRNGALHKGRVILRDGGIADVQMRAAYEVFP